MNEILKLLRNLIWNDRKAGSKILVVIGLLWFVYLFSMIIGFHPGFQWLINKMAGESGVFATEYIKVLEDGDAKKAKSLLDEKYKDKSTEVINKTIKEFDMLGERTDIKTVDYTYSVTEGYATITYLVSYQKLNIIVKVFVKKTGNQFVIEGYNYKDINLTYRELLKFPISNLSVWHYLMGLFAIAVYVYSIVTLIRCVESEIRFKWLWFVFIALGFGGIGTDWQETKSLMDFSVSVEFIVVQLLSVSLTKAPLINPWTLTVSLPFGAAVFNEFLRRKKLKLK